MHPIIHFFNVAIPTFGVLFLLGTGAAFLLGVYTARKYGITTMDAMFFGLFGIIGGISGAKILYIIVDLPNLLANPETALIRLATGGAVFYGGLIGGILGGYFYTRIYHLHTIQFFDIAVPCLALAQAFGRIGCFFNGCCYGIPYEGIGAVYYPVGAYPPSGIGLFPAQLSESVFLFILTLVLITVLWKSKVPGLTTGVYLLASGLFRFINEFFRADPRGAIGFLSTSQFISLLVIGLGFLFVMKIPQQLYEKQIKQ
ncbi:MAG TPA: prolipoprotein diacylglyceryl transferase [Acetobacterium sp.]|jgi:phosphatidylglycerol:prolipoprotein diacylglycerol transferase|uniref:prolipoprotein diacylglyceryl transferase n=1 Tax=Acetobacterium TaxID=33951 RepID=UPI000E8A599A|nr:MULTISPECIES: prolipoprotein diacylglyceryl transferase family protein [Acetobacterium]URN84895.1 prolipoprotein diacylglyceryl transferase [Acetobacterium wieringae]HAZ06234.1 prolipoprotein diacylglyceryl transferase [Acetobacterium sp.]